MSSKSIFPAPVVGVDLGATKIYTIVADKAGKILATSKKPSKGERGSDAVLDRVAETVDEALADAGMTRKDVCAVGMAVPSPVNQKTGEAIFSPNLNWRNLPVKEMLEKRLELKVFPDNDVNLGTLGEYTFGAGRGAGVMAGFFVGTGIGGGIIMNGKVVHGRNYTGGELGHTIVMADGPMCGCGTRGCLEAVASRIAITRDLRAAMERGVPTMLTDLLGADTDRIKSGVFKKAYLAGDELVTGVINRAMRRVGIAVASIVNAIGPDVVVVGGGLFEALGEDLIPIVRNAAILHYFGPSGDGVAVELAALGDDSVPLGAAVFAAGKI